MIRVRLFSTLLAVTVSGALVALAPGVAGATTPAKGGPTTTTTAPAGGSSQKNAVAKLVIRPDSAGHVQVRPAGATAFSPATDGQSLKVGDTVQTDATGKAEVDYSDNAYTRLDVNTTFTIKKLADSKGNRQVEGSLDTGRTWNRTTALTQSESFKQDAGGATAAVAGTAFVGSCTGPTNCTFASGIDNVNVTDANGHTIVVHPLEQCDVTNGTLCGSATPITADEASLITWMQTNANFDQLLRGLPGDLGFHFTATVTNGVVTSFIVTTPTQSAQLVPGGPPPNNTPPTNNNPPPPQAPVADSGRPICTSDTQTSGSGSSPACSNPGAPSHWTARTTPITRSNDDAALTLVLNGFNPNGGAFNFIFTAINFNPLLATFRVNNGDVQLLGTGYASDTQFVLTPLDGTPDTGPVDFTFHAIDPATQLTSGDVVAHIDITHECNGDAGETCVVSTASNPTPVSGPSPKLSASATTAPPTSSTTPAKSRSTPTSTPQTTTSGPPTGS